MSYHKHIHYKSHVSIWKWLITDYTEWIEMIFIKCLFINTCGFVLFVGLHLINSDIKPNIHKLIYLYIWLSGKRKKLTYYYISVLVYRSIQPFRSNILEVIQNLLKNKSWTPNRMYIFFNYWLFEKISRLSLNLN